MGGEIVQSQGMLGKEVSRIFSVGGQFILTIYINHEIP